MWSEVRGGTFSKRHRGSNFFVLTSPHPKVTWLHFRSTDLGDLCFIYLDLIIGTLVSFPIDLGRTLSLECVAGSRHRGNTNHTNPAAAEASCFGRDSLVLKGNRHGPMPLIIIITNQ